MNFLRKKKKDVVQRPGKASLHTGHQKTDIQSKGEVADRPRDPRVGKGQCLQTFLIWVRHTQSIATAHVQAQDLFWMTESTLFSEILTRLLNNVFCFIIHNENLLKNGLLMLLFLI